MNFYHLNSLKCPMFDILALVQTMVWYSICYGIYVMWWFWVESMDLLIKYQAPIYQTGNRSIPKSMLTQFTDHYVSLVPYLLNQWTWQECSKLGQFAIPQTCEVASLCWIDLCNFGNHNYFQSDHVSWSSALTHWTLGDVAATLI